MHGYSCDLAVVVLQEAAQPLLAAHPAAAVAGGSVGAGKQEHVPFALMIPLGVKMFYVFCQHSPQQSTNLERHSSFTERTQMQRLTAVELSWYCYFDSS